LNIFAVDPDPEISARMLCDRHCIKMILESAQMLCTAHAASETKPPYKPSFANHPCTIWVRALLPNYLWLCEHAKAMCDEYTVRYGRRHKTEDVIDWCMANVPALESANAPSAFALAMPDKYKNPADPVQAYRDYYIFEKSRFAYWKSGLVPTWFSQGCDANGIAYMNLKKEKLHDVTA